MAPGMRADKLPQLVRRGHVFSGQLFLGNHPLFYQRLCKPSHKLNSADDGVEILIAVRCSFFEVVKVDLWHLERVGGAQR